MPIKTSRFAGLINKTRNMKIPLPLLKVRAVLAAIILSLAAPLSASAVSGTFAWQVQTLNYPVGVAKMDSAGNMITAYTSNAGGHAVNKYDSTGKLVWSTPIGIFQDVGHILVDGANNVYVDGKDQRSDVTAVVVAKISSNGAILWTNSFPLNFTGGGHTAEHEASGPMAVGNNGSLYVLALGDYSPVIGTVFIGPLNILRINASTGKEQNRIPLGPLTIDTSNPMLNSAIAVDSANNVYYGSPEGLRK